ncbi:methylase involved in ubiquinone/menaquinone biosynthesis [Burkholderiales bacterium JOSHI_001]|nr:methylase involved in ubiquinone/menaquinone biosynthesis [Burkholderiales bacterium JOSHI_001]
MDNPLEASYSRQRVHGRDMDLPSCYTAPESVDNWRHNRMRANALPLLQACPGSTWLTIGDGAYGSDAHFLKAHGANVVASSLVADRLEVAQERGYIDSFLEINAEAIDTASDSYDFVFCKEAYHHFPRPPVALFEMIRVARKAVVMVEPQEQTGALNGLRTFIKRVLRGDTTTEYEPAGNYIYRISVREVEKLMLAFGLTGLAYRPFNDFYWGKYANDAAGAGSHGLRVTRAGIAVQDALGRLGLMGPGLCCVVIFKTRPDAAWVDALVAQGFRMRSLPENPYAKA